MQWSTEFASSLWNEGFIGFKGLSDLKNTLSPQLVPKPRFYYTVVSFQQYLDAV